MKPKFEFLEHSADIFFRAYGKNLKEVFENAAAAMFSSMINLEEIQPAIALPIDLEHSEIDMLLHDFLEELLIESETRNMIFSVVKVMIVENKEEEKFELKAIAVGDEIKGKALDTEIKAVTFHELEIGELGEEAGEDAGLKYGQVILDI